jgi:hypothetical protein
MGGTEANEAAINTSAGLRPTFWVGRLRTLKSYHAILILDRLTIC